MPKTIVTIPTWSCPDCGYTQDFDPKNKELMNKHFPKYPLGECPACVSGKNSQRKFKRVKVKKEDRIEKKVRVTIMAEEEVDALVEYDGELIPRESAEKRQAFLIQADEIRQNEEEFKAAMKEGRVPDFSKKKTKAEVPSIKELTEAKKNKEKEKVRAAKSEWKSKAEDIIED